MAKTDTTPRKTTPRLPKTVSTIVRAARDKKAFDIVVLDLRKTGGFTDYFVICTGQNTRQVTAVADAVIENVRESIGDKPALVEGVQKSDWVLIDYFNVVVHVFTRECRAFYDLERLWGNASRHDIPDE